MDDLRQHAANSANLAAAAAMNQGAAVGGYDVSKTSAASSAFSPIQAAAAGSMLNSSGFSMPSSRNYFYDPLSFPKHHSQVNNITGFKCRCRKK
jgi:hypothetical protein